MDGWVDGQVDGLKDGCVKTGALSSEIEKGEMKHAVSILLHRNWKSQNAHALYQFVSNYIFNNNNNTFDNYSRWMDGFSSTNLSFKNGHKKFHGLYPKGHTKHL